MIFLDPVSWDGTDFLDSPSWAEAFTAKSATDSLAVVAADTAVGIVPVAEKSATDSLLVMAADTAYPPVEPAVPGPYLDPVSWTLGLFADPLSWGDPQPITATDTLVPVWIESYQLVGGGAETVKSATDTLVVIVAEAPTAARLLLTDEAVVLSSTDTAVSPTAQPISSSDSLVPGLVEFFALSTGGFLAVSASDVLQPALSDSATLVTITIVASSDVLVPGIADATVQLLTPIGITASDTLVVSVAENALIAAHDAPAAGILPPGWIEYEEEELTGIAHPWRVEPRNVTPHQGWFKRKYWAIDDETGRRRVTDRWRNAARAQAWTQYHSGKQSAAA